MKRRCYAKPIPGLDLSELKGSLIVLEGPDGAGTSTQIALLKDWLERLGYPTVEMGLKQSDLVGKELMEVMKGNMLSPITLSLFYITDFADQLENSLIPALKAGFVVLADRYIFTLMARHIVRGVSKGWLRDVTGFAFIPDLWESGMDIERSGDMFHCFIKYQRALGKEFDAMAKDYNFVTINGERDVFTVHSEIVSSVKSILKRPSDLLPGMSQNSAGNRGSVRKRRAGIRHIT
jgi:dTMP kinase